MLETARQNYLTAWAAYERAEAACKADPSDTNEDAADDAWGAHRRAALQLVIAYVLANGEPNDPETRARADMVLAGLHLFSEELLPLCDGMLA